MDKNRIAGSFKELKGGQGVVGKAIGDAKFQHDGKTEGGKQGETRCGADL